MSRDALKREFLHNAGWGDASCNAMGSDASKRSYDRVTRESHTAILMNAPFEAGEDIGPFVKVTQILRKFGYSAPNLLAQDDENGFLLLEDLGDALFAKLAPVSSAFERQIYESAIDLLLDMHRHGAEGLAPYDVPVYRREASLFTDWYIPHATGEELPTEAREQFLSLVESEMPIPPIPVITLRDFHAENLIWIEDRQGIARVGLLDYQDALAGHPAYDLVSLLEDARRDTSKALQNEMLDYYINKSGVSSAPFLKCYSALGAQRNLKIVGIFTRLCCRDGKEFYPTLIPRVWKHLMNDLSHPDLSVLKHWVEENAPEPDEEIIERICKNRA